MEAAELICDVEGGIATITFNRPEVMNAFSDEMRGALHQHLESIAGDPAVRCVVLTGAGNAFCAGGDVASMVQLQAENNTEVVEERMQVGSQVMQLIRRLPQPVVAAVNGAAAGGGLNLALGCDLRLASEDAIFSQAFVKIGLVPDWGGFHFLTQLVGTAKALELMMTGDRIDAHQALALGLVNQGYGRDEFRDRARTFAERLAAGPAEAIARIKEGVYVGAERSLAEALSFEYRAQRSLFLGEDAREGMQAFVEKRRPKFGGSP